MHSLGTLNIAHRVRNFGTEKMAIISALALGSEFCFFVLVITIELRDWHNGSERRHLESKGGADGICNGKTPVAGPFRLPIILPRSQPHPAWCTTGAVEGMNREAITGAGARALLAVEGATDVVVDPFSQRARVTSTALQAAQQDHEAAQHCAG